MLLNVKTFLGNMNLFGFESQLIDSLGLPNKRQDIELAKHIKNICIPEIDELCNKFVAYI